MIQLIWLPHWQAYSVRWNGHIVGMIRCQQPLPFRRPVQYA